MNDLNVKTKNSLQKAFIFFFFFLFLPVFNRLTSFEFFENPGNVIIVCKAYFHC